jgi:ribonuclease-3
LANAFEAIIGAIYLDRGLNDARVFILRYLKEEIGRVDRDESIKDNKTLLQEYTQEKFKILPEYKVVKVEGPDHLQTFKVNVMVKNKVFGTGEGRSKKEAEQDAASQALKRLKGGRS